MALTRLEHYLVLTDDIEGTKDFYCQALGMAVGPRPPLGFEGYWVYLDDIPCIHIAEWQSYTAHSTALGISVTTPAPGTGPLDHIAFNGADYPAIRARLDAAGVAATENVVAHANLVQVFLRDPNGIKIEINVFTPKTH